MAKVAVFVDDKGYNNIDISSPNKGNPGIGGTEYCFAMLLWALQEYSKEEIFLFQTGNNKFPSCSHIEYVESLYEAIERCGKYGLDFILFRYTEGETRALKELEKYNVNAIAWVHNYLMGPGAKAAASCRNIKAVVMVSHQQYDRYIDHDIIDKCKFIYNIVEKSGYESSVASQAHAVTYAGAIVRVKGFHILAKSWKKIVDQVPDAELYVIGTGALYDHKAQLGQYGVAESGYEKSFINDLTDEHGKLLPSVHFLGKMGQEKIKIYRKTRVGIINPSARTETFGLGAVEMQSCGVPVVLKKSNGFPDVVENGKTGFLFDNIRDMEKHIVRLLRDGDLAEHMGNQAIPFINDKFSGKVIAKEWVNLFELCKNDQMIPYTAPQKAFGNNFKFVRMFNRILRKKLGLKFLPAFLDIESTIRKMIRR